MSRKTDQGSPNHCNIPHYGKIDPAVMGDINVRVQNDPNVHPAVKLSAQAYADGSSIHLGPGQSRHLPHEATHVVQQKQGRV